VAVDYTLDLLSYLKSKYLGKRAKKLGVKRASSVYYFKIKNIIERKNEYFAVFTNNEEFKIMFQTSIKRKDISITDSKNKNKQHLLKLQTLQAQEKLNVGLKSTLSESSSTGSSSSTLKHLEKNMDKYFVKNYFTTTKEITYTDLRTNTEKNNYFIVLTDGLYLSNGTKLNVFLRAPYDKNKR
jgi:hypothetical protein